MLPSFGREIDLGGRWRQSKWLLLCLRTSRTILRVVLFIVTLHVALHVLLVTMPDAASRQLGWFTVDASYSEQIRQQLGLTGSPIHRYIQHLTKLSRGNFGRSLHGNYDVAPFLIDRLMTSLPLWLMSILWITVISVPMAMTYGRHNVPRSMRAVRTIAAVGLVPPFLASVFGFLIFDRLLRPDIPEVLWPAARFLMASFTLALTPATVIFVAAADIAEELAKARWVTVCQSFGYDWPRIRRAMLPHVFIVLRAQLGRLVLHIFLGAAFTEMIFRIPGLGAALVSALTTGDVPVLFGIVLCMGTAVIVASGFERREKGTGSVD